jgi:hypothetical protein
VDLRGVFPHPNGMKKVFYSTLLLLLVVTVLGLGIATALRPTEPIVPLPVRSFAPLTPFDPGS